MHQAVTKRWSINLGKLVRQLAEVKKRRVKPTMVGQPGLAFPPTRKPA